MLTVVTGADRGRFSKLFEEMHRDRKVVFVDRLGWDVPVIEGVFEIDQFDGVGAIYLIACDAEGRHAGSLRLLPTTEPHLLSEVFPHLCAGEVPRGPDIYEITRLCTAPHCIDPQSVRRQLMAGIVEFALTWGVRRYTCLTHVPYLSAVLAVGWDCRPLGLPQAAGGVTLGALSIEMTAETLVLVRERTGLSEPVLTIEARDAA